MRVTSLKSDWIGRFVRAAGERSIGSSGRLRLRWPAASAVPVAVAAIVLILLGGEALSQQVPLPENPLQGRVVFEQKGCSQCHSVNGKMGVGPDLGQERFYGSYMELASVMWNHSPLMLRRMHELELPYPRLSSREMNELIAFIYYQRFLGEPGDLYRGKLLVQEKGCLECHSIGGRGEALAPPFDRLGRFASPLYMAQSLWNHGPAMEKELQKQGIELPRFREGEIVDLSAYIREATAQGQKERVYMAPGNPTRGREVLEQKKCLSCHSLGGEGGSEAMDFARAQWDLSVSEIAALMWNHSSEMHRLMAKKEIPWPQFEGHQMADLIAFLYFLGFQGQPGDPTRGEALFQEKRCVQCHSIGGTAASSAIAIRPTTPAHLAAALWNHAPAMEHKTAESALPWPRLNGRDLADLSEFIQKVSRNRDGP